MGHCVETDSNIMPKWSREWLNNSDKLELFKDRKRENSDVSVNEESEVEKDPDLEENLKLIDVFKKKIAIYDLIDL